MKHFVPALLFFSAVPALHATPAADSLNHGLNLSRLSNDNRFLLEWWGVQDDFHFVEISSDLVEWDLAPVFAAGNNSVLEWRFQTNADKMFFRILLTNDPESELMQNDYDNDGLTTHREHLLGSDPFNPSTGRTGIFDGIALKLGMPVVAPQPPAPDPLDTTPPSISLVAPSTAIPLP